jgi:hypothetical protein
MAGQPKPNPILENEFGRWDPNTMRTTGADTDRLNSDVTFVKLATLPGDGGTHLAFVALEFVFR